MADVRRDALTGDWVVLAPGRARRPREHAGPVDLVARPRWDPDCPFCPGNEARTPPEIDRATLAGSAHPWQVRVVPNPYPVLEPARTRAQDAPQGPAHEVIVDTPDHAETLADLQDEAISLLFDAYARRWRKLGQRLGAQAVVLFHNEGAEAGASLRHSHSQALALPRTPPLWARMMRQARAASRGSGRSLAAQVLADERAAGERVLCERQGFVAFHPFASAWPFETCIQPDERIGDFASTTSTQRRDLAVLTRDVLRALRDVTGQAPYNLLLEAPPSPLEQEGLLRWRVRILPRLTRTAGFELATHARVNPVPPEEACRLMRAALPRT